MFIGYLSQRTEEAELRTILASADLAMRLGYRVTIEPFGVDGTWRVESDEKRGPLRACPELEGHRSRDPRRTMCYHGGDDDGHPTEIVSEGDK